MVKFQYISDIHLEHYNGIEQINFNHIDDCDNLLLLGDIGYAYSDIYHQFITRCSKLWKNTFVIFGNHEYYSTLFCIKTMEEIMDETKKFPKNVYFLDNNALFLDKHTNLVKMSLDNDDKIQDYIKIIGSTLWSDVKYTIASRVNDYKFIYKSINKKFVANDTKYLFKMSKEYLIKELSKDICDTIILTHHGVHEICNGVYMGHFMESAYATNIPELSNFSHLVACINGHTHYSINTVIPGTFIKLLANCYGYKKENQKIVRYNPRAMLEL